MRAVEEATGCPVQVVADASLKTLATVKMARGAIALHVVRYNPSVGVEPDYVICAQCGFILRLFANAPSERFDFAGSSRGRRHVAVAASVHPEIRKLPPGAVQQYVDVVFDGLMTQLRSVPVGLRIDAWLQHQYPDLADLQHSYVMRQLQDNQQVLSPQVRARSPATLYEASVTINAAFAAYWSRMLSQPPLVLPYAATGTQRAGQELLAIWDEMPPLPSHDRALIDAWARHLRLEDWYDWLPYTLQGSR
jgi:hypothetical protein